MHFLTTALGGGVGGNAPTAVGNLEGEENTG